jgi:cardiolipin synthase
MDVLEWALLTVIILVALATACHALFYKRDPRAALGWIAVCLLFPLLGPVLYVLFGVNRVRTRAKKLGHRWQFFIYVGYERPEDEDPALFSSLEVPEEVKAIARISDAVTRRPLVAGNSVELLHNGEQVYPAMLETIEGAKRSLFLSTYIFETNETGLQFIDALARAAGRGTDVRVSIDGIGELYSIPRAGSLLERRGVRVARFLPLSLIPPDLYINLRNHRKILVADGAIGFIGGMNIGDRHLAERVENRSRVVDVHFRLAGPVVTQIEHVFLEDWGFSTGEYTGQSQASAIGTGSSICRAVVDGPNEDLGKLSTILVGAVSAARKRISIMTPYFLPSRDLIAALQSAALRGVEVTILLPAKNNLPFVHWATRNMLWELLERGIRVFYQPPPFLHTKLFVVDAQYALIGSANIDPRSLRLNFELAVEVFDAQFAKILIEHIQSSIERSLEVSLEDLDSRRLPVRFRDALAWLFSPYL